MAEAPRIEDMLQGLCGMADMLLSAADFFERQLEEVPDHKRYIAAAEHSRMALNWPVVHEH